MKDTISQYKFRNILLESITIMLRKTRPTSIKEIKSLLGNNLVEFDWDTYWFSFTYNEDELIWVFDRDGVKRYSYKDIIKKLEKQIVSNLDTIDNMVYSVLHFNANVKKYNESIITNRNKLFTDKFVEEYGNQILREMAQ